MINSSRFQLVQVSEPTSVFKNSIRATVAKEINGTVYTVFLAPRVLVASPVTLLSQISHEADVGISRLTFNAQTAWTVPS